MSAVAFAQHISSLESLSYLGIFAVVFFSGHIVPLPEDVILLLLGYVAALEIVNYGAVLIISTISIVCADVTLYYLSLIGSKIAVKFEHKLKTQLFDWYVDRMKKRTFQTVFVSRFIPGFRIANPIIAGFVKINPIKFSIYSLFSAVVYVPLFISLGFIFHKRITPLITSVEATRHVIFITVLILVGIVVAVLAKRKLFN